MINVSGISEARVAPVAAYLAEQETQSLIIVSSEARVKRLAEDLSFFLKTRQIYTLSDEGDLYLHYEARNHDHLIRRLQALRALRAGEPVVIIAPISVALKRMPPHELYDANRLHIEIGKTLDIHTVKTDLIRMGYERVGVVDARGSFSVRGGIIDIFTPEADYPYRVELFDTEIDSIRTFDPQSQRSVETLQAVEIYPAQQMILDDARFQTAAARLHKAYTVAAERLKRERPTAAQQLLERRDELCEYIENHVNLQMLENYLHYFYEQTERLWDYMDDGLIMVDDPDRLYEVLDLRHREMQEDFTVLLERGEIVAKDEAMLVARNDFYPVYEKPKVAVFTPFPKNISGITRYDEVYQLQSRQTLIFNGKMPVLETELKSYVKKGYRVTIVCASTERMHNLQEFVQRIGLEGKIHFAEGTLSGGIDLPAQKICYISERDIFASQKRGKKRRYVNKGQKIQHFADMRVGDYVVHENHGIGRFLGIEQLTVQGEKKDYIKIKYAGDDLLYVPVEQMDIVQKYIGADGVAPRMNKLSGGEWKVTRAKAKESVAALAKELVALYAHRQMEKGHAFGPDTVWQQEFEDSFPYDETEDQLRAIEEIKADMEKPLCMDRLLCGDVGFGKTEVAARALFKCVAEGKQAAVLVPTTILANQHYYTLKERFENFPFKVEVLSRFRSDAQQRTIVAQAAKGQIDLLIGTHRLLSSDVRFKDLGLLVIDEEQRFGVENKEKIKQMKHNIDVLTLSATPIPRTLNMSLTGIKDMSIIEQPPEERYPVQTYVMEQDEMTIQEIITREIGRGGQVFVVYNRIQGIMKIADMIERLVPEARVAVGHGRMHEIDLENVMLNFINGEYDVLISTTIIESGIDIPNANTMLILDADRYGLSQLYQLRGRVGRSNRLAYAYLMYRKDKVLTEVAQKRLMAIREFTEFGSGFKVAMRDLEIRGAGNLLGREQSGHMVAIGYELYCKLVEDAVRALQGEIVNEKREETSVELHVAAYIPQWYIEDESLKLQMYKKIATIRSREDETEMIDEMLDRFGDVPKEAVNLVKLSYIRYLAGSLSVTRVYKQDEKLIFAFAKENPLSGFTLIGLQEQYAHRIFIHGGVEPFIRLRCNQEKVLEESIKLLELIDRNKKARKA